MSIGLALLVSADPVTIRQFSDALQTLSISPEVCEQAPAAMGLLNRRKFEAVIVDLQLGEQCGRILDEVRVSASNRTAVTLAIGGDNVESTASFRRRAGFVFERPVSAQSIRSTLKPAYGMILRERRRYFRHPAPIPVTVLIKNMPEVRCHSVNIGEGGMALSTAVLLSVGEEVQIQFTLPGPEIRFSVKSTVCWLKSGQFGLRFGSLSPEHKSELQGWLSRKLEERLRNFVAQQFQKGKPLVTDNLVR
jgi:PilZ domain